MNVLFVSANSRNEYIDIEREHRTLQALFETAGHSLKVLPAAEVSDLREALAVKGNSNSFDILHFSGHATEKRGLHLRGRGRRKDYLPAEDLKGFLKGSGVKLAVLNACESAALAVALSEVVPAAIGTTRPVRDVAARKFTRDFYEALKESGSVEPALGKALAKQKPGSTPGYINVGRCVRLA